MQKAIKGSAIVDFLADHPLNDYFPAHCSFSNEDIIVVFKENEEKKEIGWVMMFDRVSNALSKGIGSILISPNGDQYSMAAKLYFDCTNNITEYKACGLGLRVAIDMKLKKLQVYGNSILVINHMSDNL